MKLRALAELCSREFFDDPSLLAVAWRRILEVLELAMPEEKKVRGNKKKQQKKKDLRKLKILHACAPLGRAYNRVEDQEDARRYVKRAKEGYEQQLGRDSKKALDLTRTLIAIIGMSLDDCIAKSRYLVKRSVGALGEENVVTLSALSELGVD